MKDLNQVRFVGKLYTDPVSKVTEKGSSFVRFSIGVKRPEPSHVIDFVNIVAWDHLAEMVAENYKTGSQIDVSGSLHLDKYVSPEGVEKKMYRVYAESINDAKEE